MKILSYNVNGLKSFISKGGYEYILSENPDIVCLQETRIKEIIELDGYYCVFSPGILGAAGVCVFSKIKPIESFCYGGCYRGRIITCVFKKFTLYNIYSPYKNLKFRLKFDSFLNNIIVKKSIVLGDFNVANEKIDIKNPNENVPGYTFEERQSFKKIIIENNLIDTFRFLYPNKIEYSFFSNRLKNNIKNNNGMRLDYFLTDLKFKNSTIEKIYLSDHLPIILKI